MKRILALLLSVLMLLSFAACGGEENNDGGSSVHNPKEQYTFYSHDSQLTAVDAPAQPLDPQKVYSSLTYVPQMFYGHYRLAGGDTAEDKYGSTCSYTLRTIEDEEKELSTLPIAIKAGKNTTTHVINDIPGYNWMEVSFLRKYSPEGEPLLDYFFVAYTVEGNKLILRPLQSYEFVKETETINYSLSDESWEYTFSFKGLELTLTDGSQSITLSSGLDAYGEKEYIGAEGYVSPNSPKLGDMESIWLLYNNDQEHLGLGFADNRKQHSVATLDRNGLLTMTVGTENEDGELVKQTYQMVYFCAGKDGWVLTDGTRTYFYNYSHYQYVVGDVSKYVSVDMSEKLEDMSETQLEAIVEKSRNLLDDLAQAYKEAGLNVTVNRDTGEITLDTTVLFGVNETAVSDEGKAFLQQFIQVYTSVVFSEDYENFVSEIMVEGHTDTNGSYEYNLELSQGRADSVKTYCLSSECSVDAAHATALQTMLKSQGYSFDKPIYNDDGEVDLDASRRVSFRFIINLENA